MKTQKACWATAMLGIVAANAVSPLQQEVPILEPVKEVPPSTGAQAAPWRRASCGRTETPRKRLVAVVDKALLAGNCKELTRLTYHENGMQ